MIGIKIVVSDSEVPALSRQRSKPEKQLFYNGNDGAVANGGKSPTFALKKQALITQVQTYHYNIDEKEGRGHGTPAPGTLSLKDSSGKTYGPWQTKGIGLANNDKIKNIYWNTKPNITIPAGTYTVIDSDPSTWSQNEGSKGFGMTWVLGKD